MGLWETLDKEVVQEIKIALEPLVKRKKLFIILAVVALIALLVSSVNKDLFFVFLLVLLGSVSMIYNLWLRISLGIELVMLATVLCAVVYGPVVGVLVGFFTLLFAEIISTMISYNTFISFIGVVIVGVVASTYSGDNITSWGIAMTILYDLIIIPGYLITGSDPFRSFVYVVTHILWNIWVFSVVAPSLLQAMI